MSTSLRIGLGASAALRLDEDSPLLRLCGEFAPLLSSADVEIVCVGATYDSLLMHGALEDARITTLPPTRSGGVIHLAARVVPDHAASPLDLVIYLLDPTDPITAFPEMQALKRQCVVHGRPFLTNLRAAAEWCSLEWTARDPVAASASVSRWIRPDALETETIGLIAHDSQKRAMLDFANAHRATLSRFGRRLATGTTGALLNGELPARLSQAELDDLRPSLPPAAPWVTRFQSGPRGGDAQIAVEVLEGRCHRLIFFEDPHVPREHEADIQLLERATRFATEGCLCINDRASAERWITAIESLATERQ